MNKHFKINKHLIWAVSLVLIVTMLCCTTIYLSCNVWTVRFEMDNNTREAIQSIDWENVAGTPRAHNYEWANEWAKWRMESWEYDGMLDDPIAYYENDLHSEVVK